MRFVRYLLMTIVLTVCCACAAFAYSPGDGWQDVQVAGNGTVSFTAGRYQALRVMVGTVESSTGSHNRFLSIGSVSGGQTVTAALDSVYWNYINGASEFPALVLKYEGTNSDTVSYSFSYPVTSPAFIYESGSISGVVTFNGYLSDSFVSPYIIFDLEYEDGSSAGSVTSSAIPVNNLGSSVDFIASGVPTSQPVSISRVTLRFGYIPGGDALNRWQSLSQLYISDGDIPAGDLLPPVPPSPPAHGGSISSFSVKASPTGRGQNRLYYEDIVNGLYNTAIDSAAYSYAEYPYNTVMCYSGSDGYLYYVLILTDKPFISDISVAMEYIDYGTYDFGFSSSVFICRLPMSAVAGNSYTFYAMSSYSAISAVEFLGNLENSVPFPSADTTAADFYLSSPVSSLMSAEAGTPVFYTMGCNYAVAHQNTSGRVYLKQSFKFADSWAYLLLQAGSDGADVGYILNQILETLRSSDGSSTVYIRLNQIYELLNNNTGLPADSPIVGAIDQSSANLNTFMENDMQMPDMSEVGNLSAALTPVFDNIFSSLGVISVLTMIGLVLGVIKLVLQR